MTERYMTNSAADLTTVRGHQLAPAQIQRAVTRAHSMIGKLAGFEVDIFKLLGMRNLSAFVGEIFGAALEKESNPLLRKNPHQDGYPDLLVMDQAGINRWNQLQYQLRDKAPFSPFSTGGVEIKATCGSVPTPAVCAKRGTAKPDMGDQRIDLLTGYDWKAHHQGTNHLMGLVWDFVSGVPHIVAIFYSAQLDTTEGKGNLHWGSIIQPKTGGGRTTSVSIMTRAGVRKMYENWVLVREETSYIRFFDSYNRGTAIKQYAAQRKPRS